MRPIIPILAILGSALHATETAAPFKKLPAVSLLPDGSELNRVMIPRHDENHNLIGSLKAAKITLVNRSMIAGQDLVIDFFHEDGSPRGKITLAHAMVDQAKGMLTSDQPVTLSTPAFNATGEGLLYSIQNGNGYLRGPATTRIHSSPETTMKSTSSSLIGATGIALMSQSIAVTAQEKPANPQAVMIQTVRSTEADEARESSRQQLEKAKIASADADKAVAGFLGEATGSKDGANAQGEAPAQPLEIKDNAMDTVVSCDEGMYFNAEKGLLVYQGNVRVSDPRFTLSGAKELKIFLAQKKTDKEGDGQSDAVTRFDEVERIMATGAVRILQKAVEEGKQPVEASGAIFTYEPATGEILLSGGYPWVRQGANFMRAKEPNLTLRIRKSGSFVTEGNWEMGGRLNSN